MPAPLPPAYSQLAPPMLPATTHPPPLTGPLADKLHAQIRRLAAAVPDAPLFQPHVTLLGGIAAEESEVLKRAQALARQLKVRAGKRGCDSQACGAALHALASPLPLTAIQRSFTPLPALPHLV